LRFGLAEAGAGEDVDGARDAVGMIELKDQQPFGKGRHRAVYFHPDRKDRCLKVMTEDWRDADRRKRANWFVRMCRPKWYFHENLRELRFSEDLRNRVGDAGWEYIPQAHGLVSTDLGDGLEVDLICDHDGELSLSLSEYLWKHGMTDEVELAIAQLWEGMERCRIFAHGRPDNVSVIQNADGTCRCVAIDGFGLPQLIPLAKWLGSARRKQFRKVKRKQARSIERILEERSTGELSNRKGFRL
jgi:hypothetical protein